ncbi:MAG: flagellar biosynthetic protein FliR [Bdellovibrionota bacterium]
MIAFDVYLTSFFSYFLRFISFLILVPIAGGISSTVTKCVLSFLMSFFVVFCAGHTLESQNYYYEILIGFLFSVQVFMKVYIASVMAELFDAGRGANTSYVLNPILGETQSYFSTLVSKYVWFVWIFYGGFEESFRAIIDATYFSLDANITNNEIFTFILSSLKIAFEKSIPFLFVFLLCDISLCLLAKILNRWQIFADLFIFKTIIGFFGLWYIVQGL